MARKFPAVLFSVLAQASVGALWTLLVVRAWVAGLAGPVAARRLTDPSLPWVAGCAALALAAGLATLGRWRAGLRREELGKAVAWTGLFAAAAGMAAAASQGPSGRPGWAMASEVAASAAGLLLLWGVSSAFSRAGADAWRGWTTPALFAATSLQLGVLGAAVALVPGDAPDDLAGEVYGYLGLWGLGAVLLGTLVLTAWLRRVTSGPAQGGAAGQRLLTQHRGLLVLRAAFSGLAALSCALGVLWDGAVGPAVLTGAGFAFAGELCGRTLVCLAGP